LYSALRCTGTNIFGPNRLVVFVSGLLAWFAGSSIEHPDKLRGILLWQSQYFLQTFAKMLMNRGILKPVNGGVTLIFALATGILNYFFRQEPENCDSTAQILFKTFAGKDRFEKGKLESLLFNNFTGKLGAFTGKDVITGAVSNFGLGYIIQQVLTFLFTIRGGFAFSWSVMKALNQTAVDLGLFLALFSAGTRGLRIVAQQVTQQKTPPPVLDLLIGFVAGLSFTKYTSAPIASYIFALALHSLCKKLEPVLWESVKPKGDTDPAKRAQVSKKVTSLIYAFNTAIVLYALQFENFNVLAKDQAFLSAMAGGQDQVHYSKTSKLLVKAFGIPLKKK